MILSREQNRKKITAIYGARSEITELNLKYFKFAVSKMPNDPYLIWQLGITYLKRFNIRRANKLIVTANTLAPHDLQILLDLGFLGTFTRFPKSMKLFVKQIHFFQDLPGGVRIRILNTSLWYLEHASFYRQRLKKSVLKSFEFHISELTTYENYKFFENELIQIGLICAKNNLFALSKLVMTRLLQLEPANRRYLFAFGNIFRRAGFKNRAFKIYSLIPDMGFIEKPILDKLSNSISITIGNIFFYFISFTVIIFKNEWPKWVEVVVILNELICIFVLFYLIANKFRLLRCLKCLGFYLNFGMCSLFLVLLLSIGSLDEIKIIYGYTLIPVLLIGNLISSKCILYYNSREREFVRAIISLRK